jgi:hypothetical protein
MDVFLELVMEEFERLWRSGEPMYDAFRKEAFTLRAIIFVTINDHPALYALSRQFKGKTGCLIYLDDTKWVFLDGSKKVVYIRNCHFLKEGHKYHNKLYLKYFGDNLEDEERPGSLHGFQYYYLTFSICELKHTQFPKQRPGSLHYIYYICAFMSNTKVHRRHPELVSLNLSPLLSF